MRFKPDIKRGQVKPRKLQYAKAESLHEAIDAVQNIKDAKEILHVLVTKLLGDTNAESL